MHNPVGWFDIYVEDIDRATKFYESIFNIQLSTLDDPSNSAMTMKTFPCDMEKHGATGALVKMEGATVGQNSVVIYFSCDDCSTIESRIVASGGRVEKPKFSIGDCGFIALAIDTEGNTFGLHSLK